MSDTTNDRCHAMQELAPELSMGLLSGDDRSDALEHLDDCIECRKLVDELAQLADSLLLLAPGDEPSEGFEGRVLERLGHASSLSAQRQLRAQTDRRRRRLGWVAAAACVAIVGAAFLLGRGSSEVEPDRLAIADMLTRRGNVVGEAYVHDGASDWLFVAVPEWSKWWSVEAGVRYTVEVDFVGGGKKTFPDLDLADGAWGTRLDVDGEDVSRVAILADSGRVLCQASIEHS